MRERESERDHEQGEGVAGEADSPLSQDLDVGLNPRTPGS